MPTVYLNPSTQETNLYNGGGNEEYYMNLIVDEMLPFLNASGVKYVRNNLDKPLSSVIKQPELGQYDLHFSLHSGDTLGGDSGKTRGITVIYTPGSPESYRAAQIIAQGLAEIYPMPDKIEILPTNFLVELNNNSMPAVMVQLAHHDNPDDATWIRENPENIARNLSESLAEFLSIPLVNPQKPQVLTTPKNEEINLYSRPNVNSEIVAKIPAGSNILVLGQWENWYTADYFRNIGYVQKFTET